MNILINESQYTRLFRPKVKITLIEGDEAQKYLDYTYLDDEINLLEFLNEQEYTQEELDKIERNKEIENNPNLSRGEKDRKILKLNKASGLDLELQNYAESYYNTVHINYPFLKFGKKRFTFKVTLHWTARLFRNPLEAIEPFEKGINLVINNIDKINNFISNSENKGPNSLIVLTFDRELYNEVITIKSFNIPFNGYEIEFVTQLNKDKLHGVHKHTVLNV